MRVSGHQRENMSQRERGERERGDEERFRHFQKTGANVFVLDAEVVEVKHMLIDFPPGSYGYFTNVPSHL